MKNFLLLFLIIIFSCSSYGQQKTLLNKNGERIRGTAIAVGKNYINSSVAFCKDIQNWKRIQDLHLNTVRVCWVDPWFERRDYTYWTVKDKELYELYDKAVENATKLDMTIIINYHNVGEQTQVDKSQDDKTKLEPESLDRMKQFWKRIAPRYKDNPNVIYEVTNEPLFGFGDYTADWFKKPFLDIYKQIRKDAPNREVIMFSFNGIHQDIERVIHDYQNDLDWNKTSVGYHMYQKDNGQLVRKLSKNFRMICTEWDYDELGINYVYRVDGYKENSQTMELYQHSWIDWSGWDNNTLESIEKYLLPDATAKGYQWWGTTNERPDHKIVVRAKGVEGGEFIVVRVDGEEVSRFRLTQEMNNYFVRTPKMGDVKVALINDTETRGAVIDYVAVDDIIKDSEDQLENTGVWQQNSCGGMLSEELNCNGYINFRSFDRDASKSSNTTITVRAKGATENEIIQLIVGSKLIGEWKLSSQYQDYTASTPDQGTIKVKYQNDTGENDVFIDYVKVGKRKFQAERMPVNTGVWKNQNCGGGYSEQLNCNGYITFPFLK